VTKAARPTASPWRRPPAAPRRRSARSGAAGGFTGSPRSLALPTVAPTHVPTVHAAEPRPCPGGLVRRPRLPAAPRPRAPGPAPRPTASSPAEARSAGSAGSSCFSGNSDARKSRMRAESYTTLPPAPPRQWQPCSAARRQVVRFVATGRAGDLPSSRQMAGVCGGRSGRVTAVHESAAVRAGKASALMCSGAAGRGCCLGCPYDVGVPEGLARLEVDEHLVEVELHLHQGQPHSLAVRAPPVPVAENDKPVLWNVLHPDLVCNKRLAALST